MSRRIRFAQQARLVKRQLPVLGLPQVVVESAAAALARFRSYRRADAAALETLAKRAIPIALLSGPLAAGAAVGHLLASAALFLGAALTLIAALVFPARARTIESILSIALALTGLALAGVAARAILR